MRILVDMDGVIANFEKGFLDAWRKENPNEFYIPLEERTTFYPEYQYPEHFRERIKSLQYRKGFFMNLSPISGGRLALEF